MSFIMQGPLFFSSPSSSVLHPTNSIFLLLLSSPFECLIWPFFLGPKELKDSLQKSLCVIFVWGICASGMWRKNSFCWWRMYRLALYQDLISLTPKNSLSSKTKIPIYVMYFWGDWCTAGLDCKVLFESVIWKWWLCKYHTFLRLSGDIIKNTLGKYRRESETWEIVKKWG